VLYQDFVQFPSSKVYELTLSSSSKTTETKFTRTYCEAIVKKMTFNSEVPHKCKEYASVMALIRKKESNRSQCAVAFEGMTPSEAQAAMAARERGHLNPHQIQRRMTHRNSTRVW